MSDFREGDQLSATIITSLPPRVMTEKEVQAIVRDRQRAPRAAAQVPPAAARATVVAAPSTTASRSEPAASSSAPSAQAVQSATTLPKTASSWPWVALASVLLLVVGLSLTVMRRLVARRSGECRDLSHRLCVRSVGRDATAFVLTGGVRVGHVRVIVAAQRRTRARCSRPTRLSRSQDDGRRRCVDSRRRVAVSIWVGCRHQSFHARHHGQRCVRMFAGMSPEQITQHLLKSVRPETADAVVTEIGDAAVFTTESSAYAARPRS